MAPEWLISSVLPGRTGERSGAFGRRRLLQGLPPNPNRTPRAKAGANPNLFSGPSPKVRPSGYPGYSKWQQTPVGKCERATDFAAALSQYARQDLNLRPSV